jgi:hypothetical protein
MFLNCSNLHSTEACGGGWRLSVYELADTTKVCPACIDPPLIYCYMLARNKRYKWPRVTHMGVTMRVTHG